MLDEEMLGIIDRGKVTLSINGRPIVALDSDSKSLDLEISSLKENNMRLSSLFETKKSKAGIILQTSHIIKGITKKGWSFSLYDKGEKLLTTGKPGSNLISGLHFNPLKLKRLLEVL